MLVFSVTAGSNELFMEQTLSTGVAVRRVDEYIGNLT